MAAIRDGDQAELETLLRRDPSFVHLYYSQNTGKYAGMHTRPLLEAADHDRVGIVKILLDYGADPNQYSRSRVTALHLAAKHGYGDIIELLITRGADVNRIDSWGKTPLYDARGGALMTLLAHGAVIGIPDQDGNTPLHEAALTDGLREAVVLCAHGANPEARNLKGQVPADLPDTRAPELRAWLAPGGACDRLAKAYRRRETVDADEQRIAFNEYDCETLRNGYSDVTRGLSKETMAQRCYSFARSLDTGKGIERNPERAEAAYRLACDNGDARGCRRLSAGSKVP